jgi:hypothetical protein
MPIGNPIRCDLSHIRLRPVLLASRAITGAEPRIEGPANPGGRETSRCDSGAGNPVWSGVVAALTVIIAMAALYLPILAR